MGMNTYKLFFVLSIAVMLLLGNCFPLSAGRMNSFALPESPVDSSTIDKAKSGLSAKPTAQRIENLIQPGIGTLRVTVNVDSATVRVILRDSLCFVRQGNFVLDSIREDVYKVYAEAAGYASETRSALIVPGAVTHVQIVLEKHEKRGIDFISHNMVTVQGGRFIMGSNDDEDERPPHEVELSDFMIGKYEVTQLEWESVMATNPSFWKGDDYPIENVSWDDIQLFLKKLNQQTGHRYRLPTEAEWEYAARGGPKSKGYMYSGSDSLDEVAWYENNSDGRTHKVGLLKPNELGLYDMNGNVWEWCQDWYDIMYYKHSALKDPQGPAMSESKVLRGGSWYDDSHAYKTTFRNWYQPRRAFKNDGFRLAESK
jgi:formylglycine-generating enzyme required for sulfatase activity